MKTKKPNIVIVGAGFGGIKAALELSEAGVGNITLVSELDHFRYYPSLYRTATGGSRDVSTVSLRELFEDRHNVTIVSDRIIALDRLQRQVTGASGQSYDYDYLILALGVVTNFFNIPGLPERAYGIKTVEDAEAFKRHLHQQVIDDRRPDLNYVIVGGGPTGIELAGVLGDYVRYICNNHGIKNRAVHIDLIEAAPRLVARMPKAVSRKIAKQLRKKGVRLYLKSAVQGQSADELTVNGKPIRSHTVVWTAGMANHPFFSEQGFQLSKNHKVRVDQYLQAEPNIFVIGDNADTPYSGMAQTALYDGTYVAQSLVTLIRDKQGPAPYHAKKPVYVMPAGPNWAAVVWGRLRLYGRLGWWLRRAADFIGYRDYGSAFRATEWWFEEFEQEDLCAICQPDEPGGVQDVRPVQSAAMQATKTVQTSKLRPTQKKKTSATKQVAKSRKSPKATQTKARVSSI